MVLIPPGVRNNYSPNYLEFFPQEQLLVVLGVTFDFCVKTDKVCVSVYVSSNIMDGTLLTTYITPTYRPIWKPIRKQEKLNAIRRARAQITEVTVPCNVNFFSLMQ